METPDSSMVRCRSGHPDEFAVPLNDPNEVITEQWQDGLHDWYTCRDAGECSIKSATPVPDCVAESSASTRRRSVTVSVRTHSQISPPCERDSHSVTRSPGVVPPKKSSVAAWFPRCFGVSHLFGVPSPRKKDSTNRTHIPRISRAPTDGTTVVGEIATAARMMCLCVLRWWQRRRAWTVRCMRFLRLVHFRQSLRVWTSSTWIHRTVETVWNSVFENNVWYSLVDT